MRFSKARLNAGFSLIEVLMALAIVTAVGAMAASSFKGCGKVQKKIAAGDAVQSELSLFVNQVEKDFVHAATVLPSERHTLFYGALNLTPKNAFATSYQTRCRPGSPVSVAMNQWQGKCFRDMACPLGQTAVVMTSTGATHPTTLTGNVFAFAMCVEPIDANNWKLIVEAAVKPEAGLTQPKIHSKEKILSRNAALSDQVELLSKP